MKKKLVVIGAGEMAEIADEYFTHDSDYEIAGFAVEEAYLKAETLNGKPIVSFEKLESFYPPEHFVAYTAIPATQLNRLRTRLYLDLKKRGYQFASYVSSKAFVWRNSIIGENTFIFENNVIQPFVTVGANCILWSGNHVGHRTVIEDNCFVTSHCVISGFCRIGAGSFLGVNSTYNDKVIVGPSCVVSSGALVVKNLDKESLYMGSPAKKVESKNVFDLVL